jgi:nucleoid DNA-binding protein
MRQRQVIKEAAEEFGLKQTEAKKIVDELIHQIEERVLQNKKVDIPDFGVFSLQKFKEKKASIPGKDDPVVIPEHYKLSFKIHDSLKELIQELPNE